MLYRSSAIHHQLVRKEPFILVLQYTTVYYSTMQNRRIRFETQHAYGCLRMAHFTLEDWTPGTRACPDPQRGQRQRGTTAPRDAELAYSVHLLETDVNAFFTSNLGEKGSVGLNEQLE